LENVASERTFEASATEGPVNIRVSKTAQSLAKIEVVTNSEQVRYRKVGAARGIRTPDLRITNAMLYQLSYCGAEPAH
jgi:hypothetical protein